VKFEVFLVFVALTEASDDVKLKCDSVLKKGVHIENSSPVSLKGKFS